MCDILIAEEMVAIVEGESVTRRMRDNGFKWAKMPFVFISFILRWDTRVRDCDEVLCRMCGVAIFNKWVNE